MSIEPEYVGYLCLHPHLPLYSQSTWTRHSSSQFVIVCFPNGLSPRNQGLMNPRYYAVNPHRTTLPPNFLEVLYCPTPIITFESVLSDPSFEANLGWETPLGILRLLHHIRGDFTETRHTLTELWMGCFYHKFVYSSTDQSKRFWKAFGTSIWQDGNQLG